MTLMTISIQRKLHMPLYRNKARDLMENMIALMSVNWLFLFEVTMVGIREMLVSL